MEVGNNPDIGEVVSSIKTPYERRDYGRGPYSQFSDDEAKFYITIRDNFKGRDRTRAFDLLAEKDRGKANNWRESKKIFEWYSSRDTWSECGTVGSLELHNALVSAHARYLIKNAPFDEKIKTMLRVVDASLTEYTNVFRK